MKKYFFLAALLALFAILIGGSYALGKNTTKPEAETVLITPAAITKEIDGPTVTNEQTRTSTVTTWSTIRLTLSDITVTATQPPVTSTVNQPPVMSTLTSPPVTITISPLPVTTTVTPMPVTRTVTQPTMTRTITPPPSTSTAWRTVTVTVTSPG